MEEEVVYGLRNPSCYLSCASLPRSGALLPGMLVFQPLTKSLSEPRFSLPLSSWQDPKQWAFLLFALIPKYWWRKYQTF